MKKLVALLLAFVYLGSTVGATVHLHYCMDKLVSWGLSDNGDNKCGNCGMEKDGNCCKDENQFLKNNIDQTTAGSIQTFQSPITTPVSFNNFIDDHFFSLNNEHPISHAPPVNCGIDIIIRNCAIRI